MRSVFIQLLVIYSVTLVIRFGSPYHMHLSQVKNPFEQYLLIKPGETTHDALLRHNIYIDQLGEQKQTENKLPQIFSILVKHCHKKRKLNLYKGVIPYAKQLQQLLDYFTKFNYSMTQELQTILKDSIPEITENKTLALGQSVTVNTNTNLVQVQCAGCGKFSLPEPYNCSNCLDAVYCGHSCRVNNKINHQNRQCSPRPFPGVVVGIQTEVHLGGDLGNDILIQFQHQSRMSFHVKGIEILKKLYNLLSGHPKLSSCGYSIQLQTYKPKPALRFKKHYVKPEGGDSINTKNFQELVSLYMDNMVLTKIRDTLLLEGCSLIDTVKQVFNSHLHIAIIYSFPL